MLQDTYLPIVNFAKSMKEMEKLFDKYAISFYFAGNKITSEGAWRSQRPLGRPVSIFLFMINLKNNGLSTT